MATLTSSLPQFTDYHRKNDDDTLQNHLHKGGYTLQVEQVAEYGENQHSEYGPGDPTHPTVERRTADQSGSNSVQFNQLARVGLRHSEAAHLDDTCQGGE